MFKLKNRDHKLASEARVVFYGSIVVSNSINNNNKEETKKKIEVNSELHEFSIFERGKVSLSSLWKSFWDSHTRPSFLSLKESFLL